MIKRLADRLFRWFCHPDYYDEIVGDLEEMYRRSIPTDARFVQWRYLLQVLSLFRPGLIRSFPPTLITPPIMIRNYIKIGTRNLLKQKLFTTINITGLALGLSSFLLINEYVRFEESYDSFFEDAEQLYRLSTVQVSNGEIGVKDAMTFHPAAKALKEELPEVQAYTVTYKFDQLIFRKGESVIQEKNVIAADTHFFKLFDYDVLQGSADNMLSEPNSLVLTESKARFYFGEENPLGKTIQLLGGFNRPFQVTGVIEDLPENTHYPFDMLISDESLKDRDDYDSWNAFNYYSYIKLDPSTAPSRLTDKLEKLSKKYLGEQSSLRFHLYSVRDIHLHSDFTFEAEIPGSERAVSMMRIIALFILIIAWVNYINLSTARAVDRAKEVGLRKVIGAYKGQLIGQFLLEALLVNLLAALLALLIAELVLPFYHQLIGKEISAHVWNHLSFLKSLLMFFILGTAVSGFYPALVLSGFKPVAVLKGKYRNSSSGAMLRKSLVVLQFTASMILIAGTFIVYRQVQYMQGKDLGIATDYVIGLPLPSVEAAQQEAHASKVESFKEALRQHSAIKTVGGTSNLPGGDGADINSTSGKLRLVGLTDRIEGTTYVQYNDEHFLKAVDMQLLAGRNFDRNRIADSLVVMVNEAFLKKFNIADIESVLHEEIQFGEDENNDKYQIIGIVKDFNRTSLKSSVEPTLYFPDYQPGHVVIALQPDSYQDGLTYLAETWQQYFPEAPLDYTFLDDRFAALYEQDRRFGEVFGTFSALAIFIATLGLFGLSSFLSIQRTVEVGVRKVLGASVSNIIGIFYKDFLWLLGIAGFISMPAIYFGMNVWLENYAYRIAFPWWLSMAALGIVVVFALLTVGYQIYKVAILDPARTLKYE